jgi:hypothetical protein
MTEQVVFDGDSHEIDTGRLTLVFNKSFGESQYPDRVMVTPEMALDYFRGVDEIDRYSAALFRMVVHDFPGPVTKAVLSKCGAAFQQAAGLMAATVALIATQTKFGWKHPEGNLHPKYQGNLADVAIMLSDPAAFEKFVRLAR